MVLSGSWLLVQFANVKTTPRLASLAAICAAWFYALSGVSPAATIVLSSSADTTLFETTADNNLGANDSLIVGTTAVGFKNRSLFKFDLSQLPANATITSAAFTITVVKAGAGSGSNFAMYRVLRNWGEGTGTGNQGTAANPGEATWNHRFHPDTPWSSPGAAADMDYVGVASATTGVGGIGSYTFSSTAGLVADVQLWVGNAGNNFGWIVISGSEGDASSARRVASREDSLNPPPVLALQYTIPAAATPPNLFNLALVEDKIRFSFHAESNRTYAIEFRDSFTNGTWNVLSNIAALPANATLHITNGVSSAERYFRARTP